MVIFQLQQLLKIIPHSFVPLRKGSSFACHVCLEAEFPAHLLVGRLSGVDGESQNQRIWAHPAHGVDDDC